MKSEHGELDLQYKYFDVSTEYLPLRQVEKNRKVGPRQVGAKLATPKINLANLATWQSRQACLRLPRYQIVKEFRSDVKTYLSCCQSMYVASSRRRCNSMLSEASDSFRHPRSLTTEHFTQIFIQYSLKQPKNIDYSVFEFPIWA